MAIKLTSYHKPNHEDEDEEDGYSPEFKKREKEEYERKIEDAINKIEASPMDGEPIEVMSLPTSHEED